MASYICKCGRVVEKSTTADNTGNRDTAGCEGCPYLLSWGPDRYVQGQGFVKDIQGYECRMSPSISYASTYYGRADDKTTLRIVSLDLDFLEEIQAWMDGHAEGLLSGGFSRDTIRGTDYSQAGRYSWSISCAQNKKGMAAKAALIQKFFRPDKSRRGKTPEEEKAIVLAAIEEGKAAIRRKEDKEEHMETTKRTNDRGIMTDVGELFLNGSECRRYVARRARTEMGKVQAIHVCDDQPEGTQIWMNASYPGEYWVLLEAGKIEGEHVESCPYCAALLGIGCGDVLLVPFGAELKSNKLPKIPEENNEPACSCAGCKREDCICAGGHDTAGRADCTGEQNCAQSGCTYAVKHRANPTSSAAATAVAEQTAGGPEPSDSADMTEASAVESNGPADLATSAAADADLPEVCRGCQCVTCGNKDCATPCWMDPKEVDECERIGVAGDDCEDYQPKEDAECLKTPAPNGDAAANTAANAAQQPQPEETPITPTNASSSSDPACPADAGAATQSLSAAGAASLAAEEAPSFDFSALGDLAEKAVEADKQFDLHYGRAQDEYLVACIYLARIHALTAKAGRYGGGTWTAWYQSKGISEGSARTMVQNGDSFKSATVAELKNLPAITKKDLNLIARQGAAEQVLEAAKESDSARIQEIVAQLKAEREAREQIEQQLADAQREHQAERESTSALLRDEQQRRQQAEQGRIAAEKETAAAQQRAVEAEKERDGARQALRGTRKQEEKWREKAQTVQAQLDQLQAQPIPSTAIDMDELERRVAERMEAERAKHPPEDPERSQQDSRDAYDAFILATRSIDNIWKTLRPQVGRLGALQGNAKNMLLQQLMKVKEELIHECENRQSGS